MVKITLPFDEVPSLAACRECDFVAEGPDEYTRCQRMLSHYIENHYEAGATVIPSPPRFLPAADAWEFAVAQMDHWNRRDPSKLPIGNNARISGIPLHDATLRLAHFVAGMG